MICLFGVLREFRYIHPLMTRYGVMLYASQPVRTYADSQVHKAKKGMKEGF